MNLALPRRIDPYAVVSVIVSAVAVIGAVTAATNGFFWGLPVLAAPLAIVVARPLDEGRPWVLAIGAAVVAAFPLDGVGIGVLIGMVFLGVLTGRGWASWVAPGGGALGAVVGSLLQVRPVSDLAIGSVVLGGGAALLLRYATRARELGREALALRQQAAWLEQRTALARDLHDVVGHHVTAMVVQAEAGKVGDPQAALERIGAAGRTALADLDRLVVHLRDPARELVVSASPRLLDIDELLAAPLRHAGVAVEVSLPEESQLGEAQVLALYRIVQEGLTNVARHARATRVWVDVVRTGDEVVLSVGDDGVGVAARAERGSGLTGIEERAAQFGGTARLGRRPGGGSLLEVRMPVPS